MVFSMPLFEEKRKQVGEILRRHWQLERVDDAMQNGALRVYFHLAATRGIQFTRTTDDALGAWLYALLHQNAQWELSKIARGEQRRRAREIAASRPEAICQMSNTEFARKLDQVFAMIEKLPSPLITVGFDLHYGVTANETAKTCGISERRVYELRAKILNLVSEMLDDMS
jgi:DNA-directed RNA polymerase specialized sigma24 family protein